jgi:hypothetical protein
MTACADERHVLDTGSHALTDSSNMEGFAHGTVLNVGLLNGALL